MAKQAKSEVEAAAAAISATAAKKKGIAKGELKSNQAKILESVKSGKIQFIPESDSKMVATTADGKKFTLTLAESNLTHDKTKAGKMVRVRLNVALATDEHGVVTAKLPEMNGKEVWQHYHPDFKSPSAIRPKSDKPRAARSHKPKVSIVHNLDGI